MNGGRDILWVSPIGWVGIVLLFLIGEGDLALILFLIEVAIPGRDKGKAKDRGDGHGDGLPEEDEEITEGWW